jgi:hypothetical protein
MASKPEPKKAGRNRKYPEGSIPLRMKLPPDLHEALEAYIAKQEVPPDKIAVLILAAREFFTARGLL